MTQPRDPCKYTFTVADAGGPDAVPMIHRLRAWLKLGLRGYHIRATDGRVTPPADDGTTETPPEEPR